MLRRRCSSAASAVALVETLVLAHVPPTGGLYQIAEMLLVRVGRVTECVS